jgi:hypothetical protein
MKSETELCQLLTATESHDSFITWPYGSSLKAKVAMVLVLSN